MKIQFEVENWVVSQVEQLKTVTGSSDHKELFNNALALLAWATQQRIAGRVVASIDEEAKEFSRLTMPALEYAAYTCGERAPKLNAA